MNEKTRNSNFELLRIILILMIITLHFLNKNMGGALNFTSIPFNDSFFVFLKSLCICAVNTFILISGYFLYSNKSVKLKKVILLYLIVILYRLFNYFFLSCYFHEKITLTDILTCFLPFNYFFCFYIVLYLISPYISLVFTNLNKKQALFLISLLTVLFCIYPTILDIGNDISYSDYYNGISFISSDGNIEGYSIVHFLYIFCVGMFIRKINPEKYSSSFLFCLYLISTIMVSILSDKLPSLYSYCSIFPVLNSVLLFLIFKKLNFTSSFINKISISVFPIFCIHTSGFANRIWKRLFILPEHFSISPFYTIFWSFISVIAMFMASLLLSLFFRGLFYKIKAKINKMTLEYHID